MNPVTLNVGDPPNPSGMIPQELCKRHVVIRMHLHTLAGAPGARQAAFGWPMPGFVHLRFTCNAKFSGQGSAVAEPGLSDQAGPKLFTMNDQYYWVLECPCGATLRADTEDAIVELSFNHLRETHPDLADIYEREHILFMAQQFTRT